MEPTPTSGVFKFTGIVMTILDRASYAAKQWTDQLATSALIGQDLYLTITHPHREEGKISLITTPPLPPSPLVNQSSAESSNIFSLKN